jgi:hypothetical protein
LALCAGSALHIHVALAFADGFHDTSAFDA